MLLLFRVESETMIDSVVAQRHGTLGDRIPLIICLEFQWTAQIVLVGTRRNRKSLVGRTPLKCGIVKSVRFRLNWLSFHNNKVWIDARVPQSKFEASLGCDYIFRRAYLCHYRNCVFCRILACQRKIFSLLEDELCEICIAIWAN